MVKTSCGNTGTLLKTALLSPKDFGPALAFSSFPACTLTEGYTSIGAPTWGAAAQSSRTSVSGVAASSPNRQAGNLPM